MRCTASTALILIAAALPVHAQESEVDRLRKDLEKAQGLNVVLQQKVEAQSAQIQELLRSSRQGVPWLPQLPSQKSSVIYQNYPVVPRGKIETSVTATADEIGLVVISVGKDDGVQEGDEFTVTRGEVSVAKIVVDRCDRKWSAGKVTQKSADLRVGDRATLDQARKGAGIQERLDSQKVTVAFENASLSELLASLSEITGVKIELDPSVRGVRDPLMRGTTFKVADLSGTSTLKLLTSSLHLGYRITPEGRVLLTLPPTEAAAVALVGSPNANRPVDSAQELRSLRKELDDVRIQVRVLSDKLISSWQEEGVTTEELPDALRSHLNLARGLVIRQVRDGSRAAKVGLKALDVVRDLEEPELLRILRDGGRISLYRQGKMQVYEVDPAR